MKSSQYTLTDLPANMRDKTRIDGNGCWIWTGAKNSTGYGCVAVEGKSQLAHRVTYEMFVGPIPEDWQVDHLCRVRPCHNPAHLEAVTQRENGHRRPDVRKSHCVHGHELTEENILWKRRGEKVMWNCRECERQAQRRRRAAKALIRIDPHEGDKG